MTDKMDETGKGPSRPGEASRRPYATIDLQAKEVGAKPRAQTGPPGSGRPEPKTGALPPPGRQRLAAAWAPLADGLVAAWTWVLGVARSNTFLSHVAAGVAGAALTLAVTALLGLLSARQGGERVALDVANRLAALERTLQRPTALAENATARLAATDTRLARLEERVQAAQSKLAVDAAALNARIASTDVTDRIAKLETTLQTTLAALSADDKSGDARFADVEKLAGEASEAKAAYGRAERDLAALKSEAASLRRSLESLKGSVEDRLKDAAKAGDLAPALAKLAGFERDLRAVLKNEGVRVANTQQVLLTLELANLKRALDRGDSYARELDAVRETAGGTVDLTSLDRYSLTGVPTLGVLTQEFRQVANAAKDTENERPDASVLDRLMAGARSIVRLRKASHDADDASVEAILGRMESALKDARIGDVLAQAKRLPPKAALAAEDWLRKLDARYAADRTIANIEAALKASLAAQRLPVPEAKR